MRNSNRLMTVEVFRQREQPNAEPRLIKIIKMIWRTSEIDSVSEPELSTYKHQGTS
jgi:hypothetical protein